MTRVPRPASRVTIVALTLIFALLGLLPQALSRTLPDIAFPLWAADRMQHGARLYVDILEINPPLFIWLDLPLTWLSRVTGLEAITWYRLATSALLFASLAGCWWALKTSLEDEGVEYRRVLWLAAAFALLLLPRLDWGEREHLSLALTLPYILLGIARARGREVGTGGAIIAGLAAGIGIALKPYFVLVWVGRELAARRLGGSAARDVIASPGAGAACGRTMQSGRWRVNPETVTVPLLCIGYLISVIAIHPEYFELLRQLGAAYQTFLRNSALVTLFLGDGSAIVLGALIVALALRRIPKHAAVWRVLAGSLLGYYVAAIIQAKGWRYHFYPALGLAMLLFAAMAWDAWRATRVIPAKAVSPVKAVIPAKAGIHDLMRLFAAIPAAALITAVAVSAALAVRQIAQPLNPRYDPDPSIGELIPLVKERAAGRPVFVISPNMASGFPLTNYAGNTWPLRLTHFWPALVAYDSASRAPGPITLRPLSDATATERLGLQILREDFLRAKAPLALALIRVDRQGWGTQRLDLIGFMTRDSAFARAWASYDSLGRIGNYTVWALRDDSTASAPLPRARMGVQGASHPPDDVRTSPVALAAASLFLIALFTVYRRLPAV